MGVAQPQALPVVTVSSNIWRAIGRVLAHAVLFLLIGTLSASAQTTGSGPGVFNVDSLLDSHPLAKEQSFRTDIIAHDSSSSVHLTQVQGGIESHRHVYHDENVWIIRGAGRLILNGVNHRVAAGQLVHIPRNTPHSFHNLGSKPAVVISVFSPGFDGKDRVYEDAGAGK